MTKEIIIEFKIVNIDKQQRQFGAVVFIKFKEFRKIIVKRAMIVKACKPVRFNELLQAFNMLVSENDIVSDRPRNDQKYAGKNNVAFKICNYGCFGAQKRSMPKLLPQPDRL
jgi:hypothetical protein